MANFPEADWKVFRSLHPIALGRYCERTLSEVVQAAAEPNVDSHAKYLRVYKLIRERDKDLAQAFNDFRRSTAYISLMLIRRLDLLKAEEMSRFSQEIRDQLESAFR